MGRLLKAGTVLYRGYQEHGVAERLDSARSRVDLPARMSGRLLERGAAALGATPSGPHSDEADYHLEIRLHRWGIGTDDWASNPYFLVEATLFLFERSTGREVWRGEVEEKDDLGGGLFSAGTVLGDVSTGRTLPDHGRDRHGAGGAFRLHGGPSGPGAAGRPGPGETPALAGARGGSYGRASFRST